MLIVFGSAKLFAEVLERLGQPGIVGEILAGAIVGPSVLGWIQPNEVLTALSELGVMFLLFRVGLEVKSSELMGVGGTAFLVALLGVLAPMAMGWGIMRAWGYPQVESFFVGAAMVATSVGITAQVLAAKGLLHLQSAKIILGAAVIDDILGLIVLAIVSSAAKGQVNIARDHRDCGDGHRIHDHRGEMGDPHDDAARSACGIGSEIRRSAVQYRSRPTLRLVGAGDPCRRSGDYRRISGRNGACRIRYPARSRSRARHHRTAGSLFPCGHRPPSGREHFP